MAKTVKADRSFRVAFGLAFIAVAMIGIAGWMSASERLQRGAHLACAVEGAASPSDPRIGILAVNAGPKGERPLLELGQSVCVTVANVRPVAADTLDSMVAAAEQELRSTGALLTQARRELAATPAGDPRRSADQKVKDLQQLLDSQASQLAEARQARAAAAEDVELALFVDGRETPARSAAEATPNAQALRFELEPANDAQSTEALSWRRLLGGLPDGGKREVTVGVGSPGSARALATWVPASGQLPPQLRVFSPMAAWLAGLGFLLLLAALFVGGRNSTLLRDGEAPDSAYSLGRVQMAFWLVASAFGYVFIWVLSGQYINVVTAATFTLLGITGATGLAAKAIDGNAAPSATRGFLMDILSDGRGGVKLHRIQVAIWTLILGAIFVWNILDQLILTDFDANLLILLGIANGVYAGFKMQEGGSPEPAPAEKGPTPGGLRKGKKEAP